MKAVAAIVLALALAACGGTTAPASVSARSIPFPTATGGLAAVIGHDAAHLSALFGAPNADVRDGLGRKLQFASAICVLDAYLYARGSGAPVVTYVDARQTDGSPIDKGSCVAALQRRSGGK